MVESADLGRSIATVRGRVADACSLAGRDPREIRLVAVTKGVAEDRVAEAFRAGISEFGENYVRELARKREAAPEAMWHFIGRLQSNKVRDVLASADIVQTIEPGSAAERLSRLAAADGRAIECLVEVDFAGGRVGVSPTEVGAFADHIAGEPGLRVIGFMTVPPQDDDPRPYFRRLRELRDEIHERIPGVVELSMGMSNDYEVAVEEGATMIRVGTAVFGPRR